MTFAPRGRMRTFPKTRSARSLGLTIVPVSVAMTALLACGDAAEPTGGVPEGSISQLVLHRRYTEHTPMEMVDTDVVHRSCFPAGFTACRIHALVPAGTPCESTRGWRAPTERLRPLDDTYEGLDVCIVEPLEGNEAEACALGQRYVGGGGGWCHDGGRVALPAARAVGRGQGSAPVGDARDRLRMRALTGATPTHEPTHELDAGAGRGEVHGIKEIPLA